MPDPIQSKPDDERVNHILRRHDAMVAARATWDALYLEIAERISPRDAIFQTTVTPEGQKRSQKIFDSTAALAHGRCAAAVESMLTPRTQRWHKLQATDRKIRSNTLVKRYLEDVCDVLFAARYAPKANYASQQHEAYRSITGYGTGAVYIDEEIGISLRYRALHLSETFVAENAAGVIDTMHRPFDYTARQAAQKFDALMLPEVILKTLDTDPDRKFKFIHCVYPNSDRKHGKLDRSGMSWSSCYVSIEGKRIVSEGGYRTFPFSVGRYTTGPRELYGRSPAMDALPSILTLNEQKKTVLRAGQKVVDPPLLLQDDGALMAFDLRSGALNYGTLSMQGEPLVKPLITNARIDIGLDLMEQERKLINDHFLVTLFQILVENPQMTATEAMLRAQEKGALLAPTMGRMQSEMLGVQIDRELDILSAAGQLPEMPPELQATGGEIEIVYDSPLTRAQRSEEGIAVLTLFQAAAPLAQVRPDVMDKINIDEALDVLAEVNGVPAKVMASAEELKARRDQRNQAAQTQAILDAAPVAAAAAKDLATAQNTAGAAPPFPLPA